MFKSARSKDVVAAEDPLRWLTFSAFWGFIYYLLTAVGIIAGQKRADVRINRRAAGVALLVHEAMFIVGGSVFSYVQQRIAGRSAQEQSEEIAGSNVIERSIPLQALGGVAGAVIPFGVALGAMAAAEYLTEEPVFKAATTNWPVALATTSGLSGLAALAVSRIAGWVARDAKRGQRWL